MLAEEAIAWSQERFGKRLAISTSFQKEGMVVLDMAVKLVPGLRVLTLDTGRLPEETYQMIETVRERYGVSVETISPDRRELEEMVEVYGPNLFRQEYAARLLCCQIRKVRPLARKLTEFDAYFVGLRRTQSETRALLPQIDETSHPVKIAPLADWSTNDVETYIQMHQVPVHPLYAAGYTSIGCAPCTRATLPGEDERAGRWWWEQDAAKECGLHFTSDGRARRKVDVMLEEVLTATHV